MTATFITHARTISELREEFLSDLYRRLAALDLEERHEERIWAKRALSRAKQELEATLSFWQAVELRGEPKRPSSKFLGEIA